MSWYYLLGSAFSFLASVTEPVTNPQFSEYGTSLLGSHLNRSPNFRQSFRLIICIFGGALINIVELIVETGSCYGRTSSLLRYRAILNMFTYTRNISITSCNNQEFIFIDLM